jgi:ketosteroid isomerase-like protein
MGLPVAGPWPYPIPLAVAEHPLHRRVQTAFNAGDLDALVALYEPDATLSTGNDMTAHGHDAIRQQWADLLALGGHLSMTTRFVTEAGSLALLSGSWILTVDGEKLAGSITAEVARRQPDGLWRYVIDCPFAVVS